jgi:putative flippase GtrA
VLVGKRFFLKATQEFEVSVTCLQNDKDAATPRRSNVPGQLVRFVVVGGLNTGIDLLILNCLLWVLPTQNALLLLLYNSLAYIIGAINSFFLNKYWTFGRKQKTSWSELLRFAMTTLAGVACSNTIIWLVSTYFHPLIANATIWANASKLFAICGTVLISFLCMRLWVFVHHPQKEKNMEQSSMSQNFTTYDKDVLDDTESLINTHSNTEPLTLQQKEDAFVAQEQPYIERYARRHSLSVVLPAHNEEQVIASTIFQVLEAVSCWMKDFEVIVVNDGSTDRTEAVVASIAKGDARVRLITHEVNQGYGAALVSGFNAASKELTFFMDSDGQFDIRDLKEFLPFVDEYDAVIGYRIDRQDTWMRKCNAWGWKQMVGLFLGVHVRDIDCAFKLLRTEFLHSHPLETRGAMINAELLYKLTQSGRTYREIGVHHLPRLSGRATGAKPAVIIRAFRELFTYTLKWKLEEQRQIQRLINARV